MQAGVDVAIATHILKLACQGQLDHLCLVAGDGDFAEAVKFLTEELHKQFWLVGYRPSMSQYLVEYCPRNQIIYLEDHWDELSTLGASAPAPAEDATPGPGHKGARRPPPSSSAAAPAAAARTVATAAGRRWTGTCGSPTVRYNGPCQQCSRTSNRDGTAADASVTQRQR